MKFEINMHLPCLQSNEIQKNIDFCHLKNDGRSVAADYGRERKVRTTKSAILPNGKASARVTDSATENNRLEAIWGKGENAR